MWVHPRAVVSGNSFGRRQKLTQDKNSNQLKKSKVFAVEVAEEWLILMAGCLLFTI
jgi:hypothetical protein